MATRLPDVLGSPASSGMRERLIVALDVSTADVARALVQRIGDAAGTYKVGLQLFTAEGPDFVRDLVRSGRRVFLDLKLHDIPNTVSHAVKQAVDLGVDMLTVHAAGGSAMLRAARDAADGKLNVLAVTVLTSLRDEDMDETGISGRVTDQALRMAALAQNSGCQGIISSPREALLIRKSLGEGFAIVTPGIRPAGAESNDQQRTATPAQAIANGASHIVVGRPITHASDPVQAVRTIISEMEQARISR
ncbi:MAG TPA: orotidine-5'-phosphate decarboxylase [Candidatus Angelobacter sp.]|nr:orotidine-5'-phosphate decarboxylase [Candidatus Angelobacter sp.]